MEMEVICSNKEVVVAAGICCQVEEEVVVIYKCKELEGINGDGGGGDFWKQGGSGGDL